jgi:predicted O-methyltransferase YrrM
MRAGLEFALAQAAEVCGMLTRAEMEYLYHLPKIAPAGGAIVEIGSYKGKSTILLALGSITAGGGPIYAIDPHKPLPEEGYFEDTEAEFRANLERAGVQERVVPMIMTSEEAAKIWTGPIALLWIDGDHRYESVKKDFLLWSPHLADGAIVAMHDTIRKRGPKRVLWENVFCSTRFENIAIVDNITAARKVARPSPGAQLAKW